MPKLNDFNKLVNELKILSYYQSNRFKQFDLDILAVDLDISKAHAQKAFNALNVKGQLITYYDCRGDAYCVDAFRMPNVEPVEYLQQNTDHIVSVAIHLGITNFKALQLYTDAFNFSDRLVNDMYNELFTDSVRGDNNEQKQN